MLKRLLSLFAIILSLSSFGAWDIFQSYAILDFGDGNNYRAGGLNADLAASYDNYYYGFFNSSDTFILNGGEIKTFKNGSSNVCGGNIYYRVYKECESPGAFSSIALNFAADLGSGDQRWDATTANIDILSGLTKGDYILEVYWEANGNETDPAGCGEFKYDSNSGANFSASFTVGTDGFDDGDFSADPVWTGDTAGWSVLDASGLAGDGSNANVGSATARNTDVLVSNANGGDAAIVTASAQAYGVWEFSCATGLNWNTSDSNNFAIILTSDTDDASLLTIGSMDFSGYYVKFKNDTGAGGDTFQLVRRDGTSEEVLIDANYPLLTNAYDGYTVKVVRNSEGNWDLYVDSGFDNTDASTQRGTFRDNTYTTSSYFAFSANVNNPSDARRVYFDNLLFGAGTELDFNVASATVIEDVDATYDIIIDISDEDDRCGTTADLVLVSGDATRIDNYTTQAISFAAGDNTSQTVTITLTGNTTCELDESYIFELQNVSGGCEALSGAIGSFTLNLQDDESETESHDADDFEDNDISDWSNTTDWVSINSNGTISDSYDLKHNGSAAGWYYVSKDLDELCIKGVETTWEFNMKAGFASTSSNNWVMAVLAGNQENPMVEGAAGSFDPTFNGYAVGVNLNTTADELKLVRFDNGVPTDLITTAYTISTSEATGIRVVLDENGDWTVYHQDGGGFDAMTNGGTASDLTYSEANYFSYAIEVTAGNAGSPRIDDLSVAQYGCIENYYSTGSGNSSDAIWSTDEFAAIGSTVNFGPYKRLIVQDGHTVTFDTDVQAKDFSVEPTGVVNASTRSLKLSGGFDNNGTFNAEDGDVHFKGRVDQSISGASTTVFNNLRIDNDGNNVNLTGSIEVTGLITPSEGTFDTGGNSIILRSDASGTASIAALGTNADVIGTLTMERFIPSGEFNWVNLGAGLTGVDMTQWNDDFYTQGFLGSDDADSWNNIYSYTESTPGDLNEGFDAATDISNAVDSDKGYMVYLLPDPHTVDITGSIQKGSMTQPIDFTTNDGMVNDGWNLVVNRYPSEIDWDALVALSTNVSTYYVYNSLSGQYLTRNGNTGVGSAPQFIPSGQSFWVKADAPGASLQWEESIKSNTGGIFVRNEAVIPTVEMTLEGAATIIEHAFVSFDSNASSAYENAYDAHKFVYPIEAYFTLGTMSSDNYFLGTNTLDGLENGSSIPVRISTPEEGTYTFKIENVDHFPESVCISIEDTETGIVEPLTNDYQLDFESEANYSGDRFIIHFSAPAQMTSSNVSCFGEATGSVEAIGAGTGSLDYFWYDEMGNLIFEDLGQSNGSSIDELYFGNYTVIINDENSTCGSATETVYVDQPVSQTLEQEVYLDTCDEEAEGAIWVKVNGTENFTVIVTNSLEEEVVNGTFNGEEIALTALNGDIYQVEVYTECESFSFEADLLDPNAIDIAADLTPALEFVSGSSVTETLEVNTTNASEVIWFIDGELAGYGESIEVTFDVAGEYQIEVHANGESCSEILNHNITVSEVVSIDNLDETMITLLPLQNELQLTFGSSLSGGTIDIYSSNGQLVHAEEINVAEGSVIRIQTSSWSKGIYQVVVQKDGIQLLNQKTQK